MNSCVRMKNTYENEVAAAKNSEYNVRSFEWIFPCTHCQSETWRIALYNNKIEYICKQCLIKLQGSKLKKK